MPPNKLYIKKPSGFSQEVGDTVIAPILYQPTPAGVKLLCHHYSKKYQIDLRTIDLVGKIKNDGQLYDYFEYLKSSNLINEIADKQRVGLILNFGQKHTVPVLITKHNNKTSLIVFDSTSGAVIRGYFKIATLFDGSDFYLNSGTRQSDSTSCITDAVCILKEALQLENIMTLLKNKRDDSNEKIQPITPRFFTAPVAEKPANFNLFKMPEQLLLTAQRTAYLNEADADLSVVLRGGATLGAYRQDFRMMVSLSHEEGVVAVGINSYLFKKARQHKDFFDKHLEKHDQLSEHSTLTKDADYQPLPAINEQPAPF